MNQTNCKKNFATAVKLRREKLCLTQDALAERADLHRTYISDIERGARNLSLENIHKLALAMETSIAELFTPPASSSGKQPGSPLVNLPTSFVDTLLVEDNADDLELILHAFEKARFINRVKVIRDGAEALDYLFCRSDHAKRQTAEQPQFILLDLKLPKVSGLEVLRCLQADRRTRNIPVVVLTASQADHDMAECRRLGVKSYIVKPLNFQQLSQATAPFNLNWALLQPTAPRPRNHTAKALV